MKRYRNSLQLVTAILVALSTLLTVPASASQANSCQAFFKAPPSSSSSKVIVSEGTYGRLLTNLRATLSGKLASVWRSEWKTKLPVDQSNQYVANLVEKFLTPKSRDEILKDLDPSHEGFVREIHERLYSMQKEGRLTEKDELLVRDPPAPPGAIDRTFTYYTRPLVTGGEGGKHQPRIRTYLRELRVDQMQPDVPVDGFDLSGQKISVVLISTNTFEIRTENSSGKSSRQVSLAELRNEFGNPSFIIAPHGKKFKLEIKTALRDEISSNEFSLLDGDHMVEKLDVNLTWVQLRQLFESTGAAQDRIAALRLSMTAENPELKPRIDAVFDVLSAGASKDSNFLQIVGATVYNRTAFESKSGFQSTIDRDQGVASGNMYLATALKNPSQTMRENKFLRNGPEDSRHVELKVPVTVVTSALGMNFKDGIVELEHPTAAQTERIKEAIDTFYPYVTSSKHPGKFNYGRKTGT